MLIGCHRESLQDRWIAFCKYESISRGYFHQRADELLSVNGTPWLFAGGVCLIEYLTKLKSGGDGNQFNVIDFIRLEMPEYANFQYSTTHKRRHRTGLDYTDRDLPEQMYYVLRCGLLHRFSLVPSAKEVGNGGRPRSIAMIHQEIADHAHLERIMDPPNFTRHSQSDIREFYC